LLCLLRAEWPCLVLLDLMLPDIDGVHVLQQLAAPCRRVPVIAMSASRGHLAVAQTVGADAVLPKPFDLDRLVDLVEAYCDEARRQMPDIRA
jgi:DNA-binding response OmpR family regulator